MAKQTRYLVYFFENTDGHKDTRFFKKGFKHCGVITFDEENNTWILIEYIFGHLNVEVLSEEKIEAVFRMFKKKNGKVLQGDIKPRKTKFPSFMGSWIKEHSCVSYVQRILGLNKWWIFTPHQLYCALQKQKFREIDL